MEQRTDSISSAIEDGKIDSESVVLELIEMVLEGITLHEAKEYLLRKPDLSVAETVGGFTVFHAAAAAGRRDLFDLFKLSAEPPYDQKDLKGRLMGDLAALMARDFDLSEHIWELSSASWRDPYPSP